VLLYPPATRTLPFPRSVASWSTRLAAMLPVAVKVPVLGSYSSAVKSAEFGKLNCQPPAIRTLPLGRSVAVWNARGTVIGPVAENVSVVGSYNSALAVAVKDASCPPATRTIPLGRRVAVWIARAVKTSPAVGANVWLPGSYNSALRSDVFPPITSTLPLERIVAVGDPLRGTAMLPTGIHWSAGIVLSGLGPTRILPFGP
jgi:hypothetical protein